MSLTTQRTGVCLLNMGGPETLDDVRPFLRALFSDRRLIRLPGGELLQRPFARLISGLRASKVRERYAEIGGGSPLGRITQRQAELLEEQLRRRGTFKVEVALRYSPPRVDEAVTRLASWGVDRIVALPLYPQYSSATTGSSFADLDRALGEQGVSCPIVRVESYHDHPAYLDALAGTAQQGIELLDRAPEVLVFSAHSLPRQLVEAGDPYQRQIESTVRGVVRRVEIERWELGYQSRTGPVRWLEPDVRRVIIRLGRRGVRRVVVVPVSFVSDHIETLHEIDIELRALAAEVGITQLARAPALNEYRPFIAALADVVLAAGS